MYQRVDDRLVNEDVCNGCARRKPSDSASIGSPRRLLGLLVRQWWWGRLRESYVMPAQPTAATLVYRATTTGPPATPRADTKPSCTCPAITCEPLLFFKTNTHPPPDPGHLAISSRPVHRPRPDAETSVFFFFCSKCLQRSRVYITHAWPSSTKHAPWE